MVFNRVEPMAGPSMNNDFQVKEPPKAKIPYELERIEKYIRSLDDSINLLTERLEPLLSLNQTKERLLKEDEKVSMNSSLANRVLYYNNCLEEVLYKIQMIHERLEL
jgi:hypothetical protein